MAKATKTGKRRRKASGRPPVTLRHMARAAANALGASGPFPDPPPTMMQAAQLEEFEQMMRFLRRFDMEVVLRPRSR